jgi:hypothetical protein
LFKKLLIQKYTHVRFVKKAVHAVCGIPNPAFENDEVGFRFSTICHHCANPKESLAAVKCNTISRKGIAYKRPDGQWNVCIGNEEAFVLSHEEIMDQSKYFVTALGSTLKLFKHPKRELHGALKDMKNM